jgi:basic membrane protein A
VRVTIATLVAVNVALLAVGHVAAPSRGDSAGGRQIGLVFDIGGKHDGSFNEAAWRGVQRAERELGAAVRVIEPSDGADRESALRALAAGGAELVIAVGFVFGPDLERLATQFPAVKFAGIDYAPSPGVTPPPNLLALRFREHEGSFVVGAIAGQLSRTGVVGFVGGMQIPLIRKFEAGYQAGVRQTCPRCQVLSAYAGTEPKAFADPPLGQALAGAQYAAGADIIFHAAGKTGVGVFAAATASRRWAIGVDSDQYTAAPCCVLTSMIKRVDVAVVDAIASVLRGTFAGGTRELGLDGGGVGFVADEHNADRLPPDVVAAARRIEQAIIAGTIEVPSQ